MEKNELQEIKEKREKLMKNYEEAIKTLKMNNIDMEIYKSFYSILKSLISSKVFSEIEINFFASTLNSANVMIISDYEQEEYNQIQKELNSLLNPNKEQSQGRK